MKLTPHFSLPQGCCSKKSCRSTVVINICHSRRWVSHFVIHDGIHKHCHRVLGQDLKKIVVTTFSQTKSFDVLSEFGLLVSCATCSIYSAELSHESEKMSQQNERTNLLHLNNFFMIQIFFEQSHCFADGVAGIARHDRVHKFCV